VFLPLRLLSNKKEKKKQIQRQKFMNDFELKDF